MSTKEENRLADDLLVDRELGLLVAKHYFRAEEAKRLMRKAGFGVTGTDILETTKQVLQHISECTQ